MELVGSRLEVGLRVRLRELLLRHERLSLVDSLRLLHRISRLWFYRLLHGLVSSRLLLDVLGHNLWLLGIGLGLLHGNALLLWGLLLCLRLRRRLHLNRTAVVDLGGLGLGLASGYHLLLSNDLLGCCRTTWHRVLLRMGGSRGGHAGLSRLLPLLLAFLYSALGVLLFSLLLFLVLRDALLDVGFEVAAQVDGQLGELEGHLVAVVALSILLHD